MTRPTKKQLELLQLIDNFINSHGYGPSYREIMRGLDYKSVSTVATHVDNLIAKGHLIKKSKSARSLELTSPPTSTKPKETSITKQQSKWLIDIISERFKKAGDKPSQKQIDELYVLTGSLKILGLNEAAESFKAKLQNL